MGIETGSLHFLEQAVHRLATRFSDLPPVPTGRPPDALRQVLLEVADRLGDNYPYHHPLYAGQMLKPPHAVARLSYALAMWMNPNNHALDGGRASSQMEKEAVAALARLVGWHNHLGHLTGGGTFANLEALWVAGRLAPGKVVLASDQAHYTHARISEVLGLRFEAVPSDRYGRMSVEALRARLAAGDVGLVVATLGTTGLGAVDPLGGILAACRAGGVRVHVDAAYGGYFGLVDSLGAETRAAFDRLREADSVVIDPHKHGLQPYGCGCVLFRDPSVGRLYRHDSPYTYFTSAELHLGEISLECSRPGAAAVALWATQRLLPMTPGGTFATDLGRCRAAAIRLHAALSASPRQRVALPPELDIVVWAPRAASASLTSQRARGVFERAARRDLHLALVQLPRRLLEPWWPELAWDAEQITCLRSVLMKPEHLDWVDAIAERIEEATQAS